MSGSSGPGAGEALVRISALGDLMLCGEWEDPGAAGAFDALRARLGTDVVFVNLETSVEGPDGHIDKAPRVLAAPRTIADALDALGVDVANLANNHAFDGYRSGFEAVREILEARRIAHFGAGSDAAAAGRECITTAAGLTLGWLGYTDPDTMPSHVARENAAGVNLLEPERVLADVERLRDRVDHVLVSLHWGVEYCHYPSPAQTAFARRLVDAGVRVVIGHHAHVVQGIERYRGGVIAYNLGNATTTDHYLGSRLGIRQTRRTRSSYVLRVTLDKASVVEVDALPIRSDAGRILVDDTVAAGYLARANRNVERGVSDATWRWRRFLEDVVLRTARKLHPKVIGSLRPRHVGKFFANLLRSFRGLGPVA